MGVEGGDKGGWGPLQKGGRGVGVTFHCGALGAGLELGLLGDIWRAGLRTFLVAILFSKDLFIPGRGFRETEQCKLNAQADPSGTCHTAASLRGKRVCGDGR